MMDTLNAKQFLIRGRQAEARRRSLLAVKERAYSAALSSSGFGGTGGGGNRNSRSVERAAMLAAESDRQLREVDRILAEIQHVIGSVKDNTLAALLTSYYVLGLTWEQTAQAIHYSPAYTVHNLHPKALAAVQAALERRIRAQARRKKCE